jgi:hypothetical protein
MRVRDQDGINGAEVLPAGCRPATTQGADSRAQDWVRQDADPVQLDQDGRMTDVGQSQEARHLALMPGDADEDPEAPASPADYARFAIEAPG